jgi:hypothetical protein
MKLHTVQLFLRSLVEPLAQSGASPDSAADLRRSCDLLDSFGEMSVGQFAEVLRQAKEYQVSKQHAFPAYLQPIIARYESLRALQTRAAMPEVNREELVRDLQGVDLDSLDQKELAQLTTALGWEVKPRVKKADILDTIWRGLTGESKPKKKARAPRTTKPKVTVSLDESAQKINDLKERASTPDVSREELERRLKELNLDKLAQTDLLALARRLSCDVKGRTKKAAIDAIERMVLEIKEMQLAGIH